MTTVDCLYTGNSVIEGDTENGVYWGVFRLRAENPATHEFRLPWRSQIAYREMSIAEIEDAVQGELKKHGFNMEYPIKNWLDYETLDLVFSQKVEP